MEQLLKIVKDKRVRFGVSFLSLGYVYFTGFLVWLVFAYHLQPTNNASLFSLYLFINFLFGAAMFYTRKFIVTKICAVIVPFEVFAVLIAGFGQWFIIIPPLIVCLIVFFACGLRENVKMVLGTIYLLMYIVGSLAYITLQNFNISLAYVITGEDLDMSLRREYLYSTEGSYRLVTYVEVNKDRTTTRYYVEEASKDMHFWFLDCYYVYDCRKVMTTVYQTDLSPSWISDTELLIDGKVRNIPELYTQQEDEEGQTGEENAAAESDA